MSAAQRRFVAVIDIGKTNAKVVVHDLSGGADVFVRTAPNVVRRNGPFPHHDAEALFGFILDALGECAAAHPIDAISVTTHGASVALVDDVDLVLPLLDYEHDGPEALRDEYDRARPLFATTFSPRLPNGLNVGAQLFWLERTFPDEFAKTRHVLFLPQYWAWRLTGVMASEATSLGCHTDLWRPLGGGFSPLVSERGWEPLFAPLRSAFDVLGDLRPALADRIGLGGRSVPVHCGIHDSNASLLPHLLARPAPFSVLSTGTWVVAFAPGGRLEGLDAARDTLANVDAFGMAVPSARFMGGREFDILTPGGAPEPTEAEIAAVLSAGSMALPSFAPGIGPFPKREGRWSLDPRTLTAGERTAAASLYCALASLQVLDLLGADGPIVVEGPFARNALYREALATLAGRVVVGSQSATGTTSGAARLAAERDMSRHDAPTGRETMPGSRPGLADYAARWRELADET